MKRLYRYLIPMLGLAAAGCSETSPSLDDATATGTLTMKVSTRSETSSAEYDPMEHLTVSICNSDGKPIRKYTSESGIPERFRRDSAPAEIFDDSGMQIVPDRFRSGFPVNRLRFRFGTIPGAEILPLVDRPLPSAVMAFPNAHIAID